MAAFTIYTDGSCLGNPGPGGWGAVIISDEEIRQLSGGSKNTTNNRMELTAAIKAIEELPAGKHQISVITDSQYLVNAFNKGWIKNWKQGGWEKADGPVKNRELWQLLDMLVAKHTLVTWSWVRGHNGNHYNEICDQLANQAAHAFLDGGEEAQDLIFGVERMPAPCGCENGGDGQISFESAEMRPSKPREQAYDDLFDDPEPASSEEDGDGDIRFLQKYMNEISIRDNGTDYPCGADPWCEHCRTQGPEGEAPVCARAYIQWSLEHSSEE